MAAVSPRLSRCGQKSKVARGLDGSVGIAAGCTGDCGTVERDVNRDGLTDDAGLSSSVRLRLLVRPGAWQPVPFEVTLGAEVLKYPVDHLLFPGELWHLGYSSALQPLSPRGEVGRRRYTLQTSTAPPSTVMDVPVAIGCCIAYT